MLNNTKLATLAIVLNVAYQKAMTELIAMNAWAPLLALFSEIPSTGPQESYAWLGALPQFKEWVGDLDVGDLNEYQYILRNKHYADAVGIDEDEIADDQLGMITPRIAGFSTRAQEYKARLLHDLLLNGTTYKAFDGVAFFSAVVAGTRPNNNILTGTLSAGTPTIAQVEADLDAMRVAMSQFVSDSGEIIGITMDTIVCHPKMARYVRQVAMSASDPGLTNGVTYNPFSGWIKRVIEDPGLSDVNDLYGFATGHFVKPFIWQDREGLATDLVQDKLKRKLIFMADFRGAAGLSMPVLAIKSVSAVA